MTFSTSDGKRTIHNQSIPYFQYTLYYIFFFKIILGYNRLKLSTLMIDPLATGNNTQKSLALCMVSRSLKSDFIESFSVYREKMFILRIMVA